MTFPLMIRTRDHLFHFFVYLSPFSKYKWCGGERLGAGRRGREGEREREREKEREGEREREREKGEREGLG